MPTAPLRELGYANASTSWWQVGDVEEQTPELRWPLLVRVYDAMRGKTRRPRPCSVR